MVTMEKKATERPRKLTRDEIWRMPLGDYIRSQCTTPAKTRAYFKRIGLTWDKKGNPIVRPI